MKKIVFYFLLILLFIHSGCRHRQNLINDLQSTISNEKYDSILLNALNLLNISDVSVSITDDKNNQWFKKYHRVGTQLKETNDNIIYSIGPMKEIFYGVLVMQQIEKGTVHLNDLISLKDSTGNSISLINLLSHSSEGMAGTKFNYNPNRFELINDFIFKKSGESSQSLLRKLFRKLKLKSTAITDNKGIGESPILVTNISDLTRFSNALDNNKLFENKSSLEKMFQTLLLNDGEITPTGIGWFVQVYDNLKICWNFGDNGNCASLIIKVPSRGFTYIILAKNSNLNKPFSLERAVIFNSVFANQFLRTFILKENRDLTKNNYNRPEELIKSEIEKSKNTKYSKFYMNELLSYYRLFNFINSKDVCNKIAKIYKESYPASLPYSYIDESPLLEIRDVGGLYDITQKLKIKERTGIYIYATGEISTTDDFVKNPWEYENVEIYFDLKNQKSNNFDSKDDDRQFRFIYNSKTLTGNNLVTEGINFFQIDLSPERYRLNIQFPWHSLGFVTPVSGTKIGFDVEVTDYNKKRYIGKKAWHTNLDEAWKNTSIYGTLKLDKGMFRNIRDSLIMVPYTKTIPILNKATDIAWNNAQPVQINKVISGKFDNQNNLTGNFKTLWDQKNLYVSLDVNDSHKDNPEVYPRIKDYGWIENSESHNTVWAMKSENSKYSGGAPCNRMTDTIIYLEPGNYLVRYVSNGSHHENAWEGDRPQIYNYGIMIFKSK